VTSAPDPDFSEPHLLVVDDDARLRELLRRYLSDSGFRVTAAADASEARSNLASFAFDLVVLDVMMPGESGLELTRALRAEGRVPVLLLTAMAEPEDRVNGLEQGADDYLSKPFEPRELVLRVRNLLQRRPATDVASRDIRFGGCRFDVVRGELYRGGAALDAGPEGRAGRIARGTVAIAERQCSQCRCADDPATPQDRARSAIPALPADGSWYRLYSQTGLTVSGSDSDGIRDRR
jgi:CheY-like chemotaxis protein